MTGQAVLSQQRHGLGRVPFRHFCLIDGQSDVRELPAQRQQQDAKTMHAN
jgi:hypothetical protein